MFQNLFTKNQGVDDTDKIKKIQSALAEADAVIIGAGAGLSTSAGFTYTGERFHKYFFLDWNFLTSQLFQLKFDKTFVFPLSFFL